MERMSYKTVSKVLTKKQMKDLKAGSSYYCFCEYADGVFTFDWIERDFYIEGWGWAWIMPATSCSEAQSIASTFSGACTSECKHLYDNWDRCY